MNVYALSVEVSATFYFVFSENEIESIFRGNWSSTSNDKIRGLIIIPPCLALLLKTH